MRSASNGSGIGSLSFDVRTTERQSRAHQQGFGCVDGSIEQRRHLGHRQIVEIPKRERRSLLGRQCCQCRPCRESVELDIPGIFGCIGIVAERTEGALEPRLPPPVID